jgi:hypothetical protein
VAATPLRLVNRQMKHSSLLPSPQVFWLALDQGTNEMTERPSRHQQPLSSEDLIKCQLITDEYCRRHDIKLKSSEACRIEAIIVELYQQGLRDAEQPRFLGGEQA